MKDKRKHHGTADKRSSEQQFSKSRCDYLYCVKLWSHTPSAAGSYGRLAGWMGGWVDGWLAGWVGRWLAGWLADKM